MHFCLLPIPKKIQWYIHMNMNASVRTGRARPTVQFCIVGHARPVRTEALIFIRWVNLTPIFDKHEQNNL